MDPKRFKLWFSGLRLFIDFLAVWGSFALAYHFRDALNGDASTLVPFRQFYYFIFIAALIYVLIFAYLGLYTTERRKDLADQIFSIIIGALSATAITGSFIYFGKNFDYSRLVIGFGFLFTIISVSCAHICINLLQKNFYRRGLGVSNTLLVGSGPILELLVKGLQTGAGSEFNVKGIFLTHAQKDVSDFENLPILGTLTSSNLNYAIEKYQITQLILADSAVDELKALDIINLCEINNVDFKYVPDIFDVATARIVTSDVAGTPLIELKTTLLDGWNRIIKRIIDLVFSSIGLVLLSPLFLLISIIIKLDSPGPVFFRHHRVGRGGIDFELLKFRSMHMIQKDGKLLHAEKDSKVEKLKEQQPNYKLEDDPRITRVGRFIRKTSIDELPQLWNVFKGELSLVGPRAYVMKELDRQQRNFPETKGLVRRLMTVKPGITGLWQVSGRSNVSFVERVAMDAYYATHTTIWMDLRLLIQTIPVVLKGSGAM